MHGGRLLPAYLQGVWVPHLVAPQPAYTRMSQSAEEASCPSCCESEAAEGDGCHIVYDDGASAATDNSSESSDCAASGPVRRNGRLMTWPGEKQTDILESDAEPGNHSTGEEDDGALVSEDLPVASSDGALCSSHYYWHKGVRLVAMAPGHATGRRSRSLPQVCPEDRDSVCCDKFLSPRSVSAAHGHVAATERALVTTPRTAWETSESEAPVNWQSRPPSKSLPPRRAARTKAHMHRVWATSESDCAERRAASCTQRQLERLRALGQLSAHSNDDASDSGVVRHRAHGYLSPTASYYGNPGSRRVLRRRHRVTGAVRFRTGSQAANGGVGMFASAGESP